MGIFKFLFFSTLVIFAVSCSPTTALPSATPSADETEREFNELMKTYKPPTEEALNDLLGSSGDHSKTTIMFRNGSSCNMVLAVYALGFEEKIPIPAGGMRYSVLRKGTYQLSGRVCQSIYRSTKTFTQSVTLTFKN